MTDAAVGMAKQLWAAMTEYLRMRSEGVSKEDACKGIEAELRGVWPKPVTKFPTCPDCDNTGYREMACWHEQRCGRKLCATRHPSWEHPYVVACDCPYGDRMRPKTHAPEDVVATAGYVKPKRRGFTRFGA